jgi:hypothetical protein
MEENISINREEPKWRIWTEKEDKREICRSMTSFYTK